GGSPPSPSVEARRASCGHRLPVTPLSDAGLTRNTVLVRCDGCEPDTGHPVDRGAELVVADPREPSFDDDVADRQQAAGVAASQRADRAEDRRLHLDAEDAALRRALVRAPVALVDARPRADR